MVVDVVVEVKMPFVGSSSTSFLPGIAELVIGRLTILAG